MKLARILLCLLIACACSFAKNYDVLFKHTKYGFVARKLGSNHIRIRVIDPVENKNRPMGFDVVRPFFILDGIYLDTDGERTLKDFNLEVDQFGLPELLSNLGYTPILVQFSETVMRPLADNASLFTELLHFMNKEEYFGFPNKTEDGMIVFGISQGGVLGLYGAYQYDLTRVPDEAPVRIYGSLDSPHQGAVMPVGLFYTVNFWASKGGSADAEAFADLIGGPGASELLTFKAIDDSVALDKKKYERNFSNSRFLYGEYRKALAYDKFPKILVSQGQMKGEIPNHNSVYYKLNRKAVKLKMVVGRAQSEMNTPGEKNGQVSHNRVYQVLDRDDEAVRKDSNSLDFVQGSIYPFSSKIYNSLREGFLDAIPDGMVQNVSMPLGLSTKLSLFASWDADTLYQGWSTFIPTTSAMDLQCGGDLSMKNRCAFTAKYTDVDFEKPRDKSFATAAYAVDPTHPRFSELVSGRHVEMPVQSDGLLKQEVVHGMQTDIWRFLCNVAKYDYDESLGTFRNARLNGYFMPNANCMDLNLIPDILRGSGFHSSLRFGYARYNYDEKASEKSNGASFRVPAGWHKVALFDLGKGIPQKSSFAIDVSVENPNTSWMKAELLLYKKKNGIGQLQMQELNVPVDGSTSTLRWSLPLEESTLDDYRWFDLVLNSDGADVRLSNPRLERNFVQEDESYEWHGHMIYPNSDVSITSWLSQVSFTPYSDALGKGLLMDFSVNGTGAVFNFGKIKSLAIFSAVKVTYWPGTCQRSMLYFDTYRNGMQPLGDGVADGGFVSKRIPLHRVVNTIVTPKNDFYATRMVIENTQRGERCLIRDITFE